MDVVTRTANVAKLIGEPARAQMLISLFSGRAMTATELAHSANVSPQTASSHLSQLLAAKLLSLEKQGRHRYYRIANPEVATALEALMALTPTRRADEDTELEPIHFARSCYDHIAGRLGVMLTDAFVLNQWLAPKGKNFEVTSKGEKEFMVLGIDTSRLKKQRRHFARQCLDWTERRHHVAGALGAALMTCFVEKRWLRVDEAGRVLHLTTQGHQGVETVLDVRIQA